MESAQFYAYVEKWSEDLAMLIAKLRSEEKDVYLIALSRKMPRFLHWVTCTSLIKADKLREELRHSNVHLITELAIPLVCAVTYKTNEEKFEGIVIDDAVIYGATVNKAGKDWLAFSGKRPYYSAVFQLVDTSVSSIFEEESKRGVLLSLSNLFKALRFISKAIVSASLPVDIEYPIVNIDAPYDQVKNFIKENLKDNGSYEVKATIDTVEANSFTILLPEEEVKKYNNDFAKIRLFPAGDSDNSCKMEIIAANEVSVKSLNNKDYFKDEPYIKLWNTVRDILTIESSEVEEQEVPYKEYYIATDGRVVDAIELLLMVWANYLLSLSSFFRHYNHLIPQNIKPSICPSDLELILGKDMTEAVLPQITALFGDPKVSSSERADAKLPILKIDSRITESYCKIINESIDPEFDLDRSLNEIFSASHFTSNLYSLLESNDHVRMHNAIGETFDSIPIHLKAKVKNDPNLMSKIHQWIDKRIDESRIAPKYARVISGDGEWHYRRFFFSGTNEIDS